MLMSNSMPLQSSMTDRGSEMQHDMARPDSNPPAVPGLEANSTVYSCTIMPHLHQARALYSRLTEESGRNVSHVSLLELVVLTIVVVNSDKVKGIHDSIDVKSHADEAIDKVLVVSLVSVVNLVYHCGPTLGEKST
jgi:hypothetical protein